MSLVAAWQMYYAINEQPLPHLEFYQEISVCFMKTPLGLTLQHQICEGPTADLPAKICFDGVDHTKVSTTQGNCKICQKTRCICSKCGVCLHYDNGVVCFDMYHTNL